MNILAQNSSPHSVNDQRRERVHRRRAHQDQIPGPTAQTTRNESACTAEARTRAILLKFNESLKKKQWNYIEKQKNVLRTRPWISKRGNLVDKVVLPLVGTFLPAWRL